MAQSNTSMLSNLQEADAKQQTLYQQQVAKLSTELEQTKQALQEQKTQSERQVQTLKSLLEDARVRCLSVCSLLHIVAK